MAEIKFGVPFGLDGAAISDNDWQLAMERVVHDLRSDFIYAPHLGYIYRNCGHVIIKQLKDELKAGSYLPGMPLTMEVPKSFRISVKVTPPRLGPSYSRPGSILLPKDRLFFQALADKAAPIIDAKTDHSRSFSHRLDEANPSSMFLPTRTCWNELQKALSKLTAEKNLKYVLKVDVANFFGSINQHTLINVLSDAGFPKNLSSRLEPILTTFAGERSSRGIIQGIYPSDLFGNFYLEPLDRYLSDNEIPSARYVDDIYIFLPSVASAGTVLRGLISELRRYDLTLNEAKSAILPKFSLNTEEPDLEELFDEAVREISDQIDDDDFDADYGFQSEWEDDEDEESDEDDDTSNDEEEQEEEIEGLELAATKVLFDSIGSYPGREEQIERFCLPLFTRADSDYAVQHVLEAFAARPSMSQIYASYLTAFVADEKVYDFLVSLLTDTSLFDWQQMWVLAALFQTKPKDDGPVKAALKILQDGARHEGLRAVAAIYVGKHGDAARRHTLRGTYVNVSTYVQSALYYSSRYWPPVERNNAKAIWGEQSALNSLLTKAMAK